MLYVFYGNDTVGVREKAHAFVVPYEEKGVKVERIDADTYLTGVLQDAAGATSLFGDTTLYIIDTPSTSKEMYEDVVAQLDILGASESVFVIIEEALLAPEKKKFAKHATEVEESKKGAGERFNTFAMADALARKDKKSLWLLLQEAKREGLSEEEIIGVLWWQLKSMRVAAVTTSAGEAGMKDFPYSKAKRALVKFSEKELLQISHNLLSVYHDGHGGVRDIDLALEKWTLTL